MSADISGCVFDAEDAKRAGFQLDPFGNHGAIMVIDLELQPETSEASGNLNRSYVRMGGRSQKEQI
jgi:hypothetical protein